MMLRKCFRLNNDSYLIIVPISKRIGNAYKIINYLNLFFYKFNYFAVRIFILTALFLNKEISDKNGNKNQKNLAI